jgi:uncharacterized membrane protein
LNLKNFKNKTFNKSKSKRFIEIDVLRGLAILLMMFGHLLWDLDYFGLIPMNNVIYASLQSFVPQLFFILVGMSIIVSKKKIEASPQSSENAFYKRLIIRGLKVIGLGMILTIGSLIFIPSTPVYFGVLHCIGLSIILAVPFLKYRKYCFLFAFLFMFIGWQIGQINFQNPNILQFILGLHPVTVYQMTVDYFPLLPWFGITLLGVVIGDVLYCGNKRRFRMPEISNYRPTKLFSWMGQHSLGIYLIHQPILAGAISVFILL